MAYKNKIDQAIVSRKFYLANKKDIIARKKARLEDMKVNNPEKYQLMRDKDNARDRTKTAEKHPTVMLWNHTRRRKKYGLSEEAFKKLGNRCNACGVEEVDGKVKGQKKRLQIDHCHTTEVTDPITMNSVRGMLCHHCNSALGYLGDDIENVAGLLDHMIKFEVKWMERILNKVGK